MLTRDDHRARMDKRIGAKDFSGAKRAAQRLGSDELAIVKACATVKGDASKALELLDSVSTEARTDLGYTLCRVQALRLRDKIEGAARAILAAARHSTAYYGQLARANLGLGRLELRAAVPADPASGPAVADDIVRAADMLYAIGERDLVVSFAVDLAENCGDVATLAALGELTFRRNDARGMLELGKTALSRGLPVDHYAFPTIGIPQHTPIAPDVDRTVIYSVARTESAFDQRDRSSASAVGLMQVTPEAGRDTAKRFGVTYDWDRMVSDPVYNTQMGAAELSALLKDYGGSHIMTFAGYKAGRVRVRGWVKQFCDPRESNIGGIVWAERIPIFDTRNYVQRVMENLLVYRVRFDTAVPVMAKIDQHQGARQEANSVSPSPIQASDSE